MKNPNDIGFKKLDETEVLVVDQKVSAKEQNKIGDFLRRVLDKDSAFILSIEAGYLKAAEHDDALAKQCGESVKDALTQLGVPLTPPISIFTVEGQASSSDEESSSETEDSSSDDEAPSGKNVRRAVIKAFAPNTQSPTGPFLGAARVVKLRPFFLQHPSDGETWKRRLDVSKAVWGKLGITVEAEAPVTVQDVTLELSDKANTAKLMKDMEMRITEDVVPIFVVDNDLNYCNGGEMIDLDGKPKSILLSGHGSSSTLLAHELGHVLGLNHPGDSNHPGEANTIMAPSESINTECPTRNTLLNYHLLNWSHSGKVITLDRLDS